ncbi:MAG: glycosyltransferase [Verrucomicrobiaceae bacterium]|nr:glycosyltransferase [Verrucomicrobiaceae bacterium]
MSDPVVGESGSCRVRVAGKFFRAGEEKFYIRGLTYGPFSPGGEFPGLKHGVELEADLASIVATGANTIRLYESPPEGFLDVCAEHGIRVIVGVSWPDHVDFINQEGLLDSCLEKLRQAVIAHRGHPALLGYFIGNEISATIVRWLGPHRVKALLEELIVIGRREDPHALFAYANYPSTEYLNPENADFIAYNVYLEGEEEFTRYVARLQNIAGDKPLVISEFGADSLAMGMNDQARVIASGVDACIHGGVAGVLVFAFTDEWHRGGADVTGWEFGVFTRQREKKPSYDLLKSRFERMKSGAGAVKLSQVPRISVIICSYNGSATLRDCLESTARLCYPDFEVLVVDDGSSDSLADLVSGFPEVRYIYQEHAGLGVARNRGAAEATGEVLAYTDDDCVVDEDWLHYLAAGFEKNEFSAVGGPNISPLPVNRTEACVAVAPGTPAHVLLDDRIAEHLPGCNLAVTREAFDAIGGFSAEYVAAGDDVDFCWRLQDAGFVIGFSPPAMVWHRRRISVMAYLRQQIGYGRAEAILIGEHPERYGMMGGARWRGIVYCGNRGELSLASRIYRGVFGYAAFQAVYAPAESDFFRISTGVHWVMVTAFIGCAGIFLSPLLPAALLMGCCTLFSALKQSWRSRIDPGYAGPRSRAILTMLCLAQPVLRGAARSLGAVHGGSAPRGPFRPGNFLRLPKPALGKRVGRLQIWSEKGLGRDLLLAETTLSLQRSGLAFVLDNGWKDWDLEVKNDPLWRVQLTTVTEYHGDDQCLTRARFASKATGLNLVLNVVMALLLVAFAWGHSHRLVWLGSIYLIWWGFLEIRHRQLVASLSTLVTNVARDAGFNRVDL